MAYHLTHPNSELEIERDAADVPMYLTQGWRTKKGVKPPESAGEPVSQVVVRDA